MKFDIIFGHYINYVQGVNSVTNMFLHGKNLLQENGVQLNSIYHPAGVFDCVKNDDLYTSADGTEDARYAYNTSNWKKNISKFAMKSAIGQALHYYVRNVIPAKKTIDRIPKGTTFEAVLFQDALTAYFFFKRGFKCQRSLWLSHSNDNIFQPLEDNLPKMNNCKILAEWYKRFYYVTCNCVDKVVFLSPSITNAISFIPAEKKTWVFNGIEDKPFSPHQHNRINIIILGSVISRKGQIYLLKSLPLLDKRIKDVIHVYVAGTGTELKMCQDYVTSKDLNELVTFCGQVSQVNDLLMDMDILVLPSENEGMPISILEGMRQGVYTMVTKVGGCVDMLTTEVGEFIERDERSIARSITHVVEDSIINDNRKKVIRKHFEDNFSLERFITSYANLITN